VSDLLDLSRTIDLNDLNGVPHRREIPESSGAIACVGFDWKSIIELLSNAIGEAAPEIRKRETAWLLRARNNGIRIEFYEDEGALERRIHQQTLIEDGPQVHAGRLTWW
jgi:hypothetical protein